MAMATALLLALALQSIDWSRHSEDPEMDGETGQRMHLLVLNLKDKMSQLLQELVERGCGRGALLLAASRPWQFWVVAALLVLLLGLCCWLRKRSRQPASSSNTDGTTEDKPQKEAQRGQAGVALDVRTISATRLLDLSESFTMVEELVDELLRVCGKLTRNSFMPRLKPVIGVGSALRGWSACKEDAAYSLLVPLKPPRGHVFRLELGTPAQEVSARNSGLRVELCCTCLREPLAEDMLCFLHHPQEKLQENQAPSLLRTLCTGPYLDMDKTARWLQIVIKGAWAVLPQSRYCQLTLLPSRHSCRLRLTHTSKSTILIEMKFGVKQGGSYTFLRTE